jgi:hypothetical protein
MPPRKLRLVLYEPEDDQHHERRSNARANDHGITGEELEVTAVEEPERKCGDRRSAEDYAGEYPARAQGSGGGDDRAFGIHELLEAFGATLDELQRQ